MRSLRVEPLLAAAIAVSIVAPVAIAIWLSLTTGQTSGYVPSVPEPLPASAFRRVEAPSPTASPEIIRDFPVPTVSVALQPPVPTVAPKAEKKQTPTPKPTKRPVTGRSGRVAGVATWYCLPGTSRCTSGFAAGGAYGAAGPELRKALGKWRGKTVYVNGVAVTLIDFCACNGAHVVDVYHSTWSTIPNPSHVVIRW